MKNAKVLLILSSLFPFFVGLYHYARQIAPEVISTDRHVAYTNLIAVGVVAFLNALIVDSDHFKVPRLLLGIFLVLWSGGNDTYIVMRYFFSPYTSLYIFPFPVISMTLGAAGLFIQAHSIKEKYPRVSVISRIVIVMGPILILALTFFVIKQDRLNPPRFSNDVSYKYEYSK